MLNPEEGGRLDAKRHYVILAKALDGIWPVVHACAVHWMVFGQLVMPVQCCAVLRLGGGGGCLSTALHRHDQLAKYHPVPWLR